MKCLNTSNISFLRTLVLKDHTQEILKFFFSMLARIGTYRSSFIPSSVKSYNSFEILDRSFEYVNSLMKRPCPSLLYHGSRSSGVTHVQLRMKCSKVNFHLFSLHVVDSPACPCGLKPLLVTMSTVLPS